VNEGKQDSLGIKQAQTNATMSCCFTYILLYDFIVNVIVYNIVYNVYILKMLGLYLDTLIIGQIFCSMLCILNELTLHTE